jgi:hypothetical protein
VNRLLLFAILMPLALLAQNVRVSGLVRDSSGAVLPEATVTLVHTDTGSRHVSRSNSEGFYAIPVTQPGVYKAQVRKDGFQTAVQAGVRLEAGQNARIDFTLRLSVLEESMDVTAERDSVLSEGSGLGTVIGRDLIEHLPLNGRGLLGLIDVVPGITVTPAGSGESGQFSASGQRADANYITVDGIAVNTGIGVIGLPGGQGVQLGGAVPVYTALGSMQSFVSAEAVEEFHIQTSGGRADIGRTIGAHLSFITRTGSNAIHGSVFEYLRNEALDGNDWFANRTGQRRPVFRMNDFGGSLGGPLARNRTFFFLSHESLRLDHPAVETEYVPTALSRAFAPPSLKWLLQAIPLPNGPVVAPGLALLTLPAPRSSRLDSSSLRLDHSFRPTLRVFARLAYAPSGDDVLDSGALRATSASVNSRSLTIGADATFGHSAYNSLRLNATAVGETAMTQVQASGNAVDLSRFVPALTPASQTVYGLDILSPTLALVSDSARGGQRQWNLADQFNFVRGRHLFGFGVDYRRLAPDLSSKPFMVGAVFANLDGLASGAPLALSVSHRNTVSLRLSNLSAFAQDSWRVSPRLTLNYGVRWEFNPAPDSGSGAPLFESVTPGNPVGIQFAPQGTTLWTAGLGHLAPRIGFAWKLDSNGKLVLRSSAGLFYDPGFGPALEASISQLTTDISLQNYAGGVNVSYSQYPTSKPASAAPLVSNFRIPLSVQWNTTLEREMSRGVIASLSYAGALDRSLLRFEQSQITTGESLEYFTNHGDSSYHSLQTQVRSRYGQSLDGMASFTWAHSIDNVSRDGDLFLSEPAWPGSVDRGNSSFDVRRSFSAAVIYHPRLLHGWSLNAIYRARSGFPLTITGINPNLMIGIESRPNLVFGQAVWIDDPNSAGGRRLNRSAFANATSNVPGSLGRNSIEGFAMSQMDLAIERQFTIWEGLKAQFHIEAFNAFNHPSFGNPDTFLMDPAFGRATSMLNQFLGTGGPSAGLIPAFQIGGPRSLQAALRFQF